MLAHIRRQPPALPESLEVTPLGRILSGIVTSLLQKNRTTGHRPREISRLIPLADIRRNTTSGWISAFLKLPPRRSIDSPETHSAQDFRRQVPVSPGTRRT